jgi:ribosome recycling factor
MPQTIFNDAKSKMEKTIENFEHKLAKVRTGRANAQVLNDVMVEYYGVPTPLTQIASVSTPEPRQLLVKPYDKSCLKDMEHALNAANLGVHPNSDGEVIRLTFAALTEETRKDLVKEVKKIAEAEKIAVRNVRRHTNDALKKLDITEDDQKGWLEDVQELTDSYIKKIEEIEKVKESDILSI